MWTATRPRPKTTKGEKRKASENENEDEDEDRRASRKGKERQWKKRLNCEPPPALHTCTKLEALPSPVDVASIGCQCWFVRARALASPF